jgi:hypothetical protein
VVSGRVNSFLALGLVSEVVVGVVLVLGVGDSSYSGCGRCVMGRSGWNVWRGMLTFKVQCRQRRRVLEVAGESGSAGVSDIIV